MEDDDLPFSKPSHHPRRTKGLTPDEDVQGANRVTSTLQYDSMGRALMVEDAAGLRAQTTYTTPNGTTQWVYGDYVRCGNPLQGALAFQTMVQLDSYGDPTTNEFHYAYDQSGRLVEAAFAQTPTAGSASNGSWYSANDPAESRAHVVYDYDAGGRCAGVYDYWDTLDYGPPYDYDHATLLSQVYHYDAKGQRSDQEFYHGDSGSWVGDRTETYEYDAQRGFLTAVDYNDGLAGEEPSWTYDLAGNRSTSGQSAWTYDDLNRLVSGGGYTYQSDIMGNRTWRNYGTSGVQRYVYDVLNRCTSVCGASDGARYEYRPDGLRVEKVSGLSVTWNPADRVHGSGWYDENWIINKATSRYFYDGQMCMEEDSVALQYEEVYRTRYGLGPRGIDWMETSISGSQRNQQYPLYDGHGNMLATISLSGTLSNLRAYDAWGGVRDEASVTTDPNTRYCANLGHKQDDESGLIYMRARFYDAGTGRFISEDPAMQGTNWFVYCNNDPVNRVDASGKDYEWFNHLFHNAPQWFEDGMRAAWAQGGLAGIADFLEEHFRFANFALALGRQPVINASGMCLRLLIHEMKMAEFLEWGWLSVEQEGAIEYLVFDVEHIADLIMVAEEGDLLDL